MLCLFMFNYVGEAVSCDERRFFTGHTASTSESDDMFL